MAVSALDVKRPDASRDGSTLDGAWDQADVAAMSATIADEDPMTTAMHTFNISLKYL